jgi:hypothetical protein
MIQNRIIAMILGAALLCSLAAVAGAVVATWKADAACAKATLGLRDDIARLNGEKRSLELAIAEQNKGVAVAEAQTLAATEAKQQAERHAADLAAFSESRMKKLERVFAEATSCDAVLKRYWELRQ